MFEILLECLNDDLNLGARYDVKTKILRITNPIKVVDYLAIKKFLKYSTVDVAEIIIGKNIQRF